MTTIDNRVSIVMPAFNCADTIEAAIDSVLNQTYVNWELIIIDDFSSDATKKILDRIKLLADTRIRIYFNDRNIGPARTRNRAIRLATGRWIAFLDSDDLWLPHKLERQIAFMETHHLSFSYTDYEQIDDSGKRLYMRVSGPKKISQRLFKKYCWVGCLTVIYDATKIGLVQIPPLQNREDYALWLKVSKKADCYRLPETHALYRKGRQGSQSSGGSFGLIKYHYQMFRLSEEETPAKAIIDTFFNLIFGTLKKTYFVRAIKHES